MYKGFRIAVVIPAHNEADHIGQVLRTTPGFVDDIIVVDDSSRDNTAEVARQSGDARLIVLQTETNCGVGGAIELGYRKALELDAQILVKMDGDGQMLPEYLPALLDAVIESGYDYAKGNRFLASESLGFMPRHRLFGNIVLTFLTKLASGYWHIFDPQNGYTAIKSDALRTLDLNAVHKRFFFENDMLIQLNMHGCRVKDVAIPAYYGTEESDLNVLGIGVTFPFLLLRKFFHRVYQKYVLRDFSPIALFLFVGIVLFGWGMIYGAVKWIEAIATGHPTPIGTIMLVVLPLILGFQLLLQAIVLDINETPR
jgi:glycosyltransferase involved in cell wall biosynthesis